MVSFFVFGRGKALGSCSLMLPPKDAAGAKDAPDTDDAHCYRYIGVAQGVDWLEAVGVPGEEMPVCAIEERGIDDSDNAAHQDVAKVMHAEVHPRIAGE